MNDKLPPYFSSMKPQLPEACGRYEIRSPKFHLPTIYHKYAEQTIKYCLVQQLNKEKCPFNITAKVYTHSFLCYKVFLKNQILELYSDSCEIVDCYVCRKTRIANQLQL